MRSRVLLAVGAWLLGVVSATAGSLYAVGQLGNGLLAVSTKQISVAMVNADLAREKASPAEPQPDSSQHSSDDHRKRVAGKPEHIKPSSSTSQSPTQSAGTLLTSPDGSAEAVCTAGGAYLSWWIAQTGFEVDDVLRGPAAVASVTFQGTSAGIDMNVSCHAGVPVKQLVNLGQDH